MSTANASASFRQRPLVSGLYVAGMVAVFLGERFLGAGTGGLVLSGLGLALVALAVAWRVARMVRAGGQGRVLERWGLGLFLLGALGLGLYFLQSDAGARVLGTPLSQQAPRLAVVLAALAPALLALTLIPLALVELAAAAMARAPVLETGRVRAALHSGLGLSFLLVFAFSAMYVATQANTTWDLSYFRTSRPGEATRKVVRGLNEPLQVTLFFPPANDVGQQVEQYFRDLTRESPHLRVEVLDQAVEPARARDLGVNANGSVVFNREQRRELLMVGVELERARGQLRRLDQEVHRRLRGVARPRQVLYLTTGHGERSTRRVANPMEGERTPISQLEELLRAQNVDVRPLGASEGLGTEVPRDASAVAVLGPSREFLPEELTALREYVNRGGRLWLALEPDGPSLEPLLASLGLKLLPTRLANDQVYFRTAQQQSDRGNLGTAGFSSHPSVSTLASLGGQAPVAFLGAGALELLQPLPQGVSHDVSVRAHAATFQDVDGNFVQGQGEERRPWPLVVAVQKSVAEKVEPARAVVMGDSDALSDGIVGNLGNAYLAVDTLRWLTGEESLSGTVSSEEDVPLQHTRQQDVAWFYATVFLAPAMVLGVGFIVTRRRGRRRAARGSSPAEGGVR